VCVRGYIPLIPCDELFVLKASDRRLSLQDHEKELGSDVEDVPEPRENQVELEMEAPATGEHKVLAALVLTPTRELAIQVRCLCTLRIHICWCFLLNGNVLIVIVCNKTRSPYRLKLTLS